MKKRMIALAVMLILALSMGCTAAHARQETEIKVPVIGNVWKKTIPDNEALRFTRDMKAGWNLGNTFDAFSDGYRGNHMNLENMWCGAKTTENMIEALHQAGFRTLRLPVSWHQHVDQDFNIDEEWLARVQQVVDWAIERDMYVILNTHHDVYPEYYYPLTKYAETSDRYIASIWRQLADRFRNYDQKLIFESMNEPRLKGTGFEWSPSAGNADCKDAYARINALNQLFVDTVRAAGGENADRYLMVPPYAASPDQLVNFVLPTDTADNKIIVSIHAYTPYAFALDAKGTNTFNRLTSASTRDIELFMNRIYNKFIAAGIPVVIGEFGAREKDGNLQARVDYTAYYVAGAAARGIPCCLWDNHVFSGTGERFGVLRRGTAAFAYPEIVEAMMLNAMQPLLVE